MAEEKVAEQEEAAEEEVAQQPVQEAAPAAKAAEPDDAGKKKEGASHLLKVWYVSMILCILGLAAIGILFQDDSVFFYVFLGVVVLCITPVISLFKAMSDLKRLHAVNAAMEQKRKEELERLRVDRTANMTFEEIQELERQKAMATTELAKRHASKEGDVKETPKVPLNA